MCKARPALYQMLGHDGPPQGYWRENLVDGRPLQCCPVRTVQLATPDVRREVKRHLTEYHPLYERGHLLVAGGVADQPAKYLDYMREIDRLKRVGQAKYEELTKTDGGGGDG